MIEAWKEISDLYGVVSPPPAWSSVKEKGSAEHYPADSKTHKSSTTRVKSQSPFQHPVSGTTFSNNSPARKSSCKRTESRVGQVMFRKLDLKKPSNSKLEISPLTCFSGTVVSKHTLDKDGKEITDKVERSARSETECARIDDMYDMQFCVSKSGGEVVTCGDASVLVSNETGDIRQNRRECEELSLIRKQLVQIETQQSHLLDLLQIYGELAEFYAFSGGTHPWFIIDIG